MKKVFIIILNYNGGEDTVKCLTSLSEAKILDQAKIIIVDNASTDNSVELIKKNFPSIKIIQNKKNLGFAGGNNVGIKDALQRGADYALLLNTDTLVKKNILTSLVKHLESDETFGIAAPAIEFKINNESLYDLGGKVNWFTGRTTHNDVKKIPSWKEPIKVEFVTGACMLIKKEVFEKIGLLDERFFMFFEDADFCLRARKAGYSTWVVPEAQIYHKLSASVNKTPKKYQYLLKSNLKFINKHLNTIFKPIGYLYLLLLAFKIKFKI